MDKISNGLKNFIFPNGKQIFPNSLTNFWDLKKWNISFIMLSLKCWHPKFPIFFSIVKLKLGHKFSQSIYRFKIVWLLNLSLSLYFQVLLNSPRSWKSGFLNVAPAGLPIFSQFMEEIENLDFLILATLYFYVSPNSLSSKETGIFWSSLTFIFCQIVRIAFPAGCVSLVGKPIFVM